MITKEKNSDNAVNLQENATETNIYNTKAYKQSRVAYKAEALLEYLISLTLVDSFLAVLGKSIGMSDALLGICGSLVSFAGLHLPPYQQSDVRRPVHTTVFLRSISNGKNRTVRISAA